MIAFDEADHRIVTIGVIGMDHPIGADGAKNGEILIGIGDGSAKHRGCKSHRPRHILDEQVEADARPDRSSGRWAQVSREIDRSGCFFMVLSASKARNPVCLV